MTILSVIGAILVLWAFFITNGRAKGTHTMRDEWCNAIGATFLCIYAISTQAWVFVVTNGVWALWSFWILARFYSGKRK